MNNIYRPNQSLDALRIRAEIETASRATTKRPTWAPAVVLDGELLELCRELEFLTPDDKPVARLWAEFADPKRQGTVIRNTFSKHPLDGVRCRGFEMRAGEAHSGHRITTATMDADGSWSVGHLYWKHSDLAKMRYWERNYRDRMGAGQKILEPRSPPKLESAEEIEKKWWTYHPSDEPAKVAVFVKERFAFQARMYEQWEKSEAKRRDPDFIEDMHARDRDTQTLLEKKQREIAKEEATPDWRYKALTRMTELATDRLLQFIGDPETERRRGASVTGSCFCCGKTLTDKISVERGVGPECVQHLRIFDLTDLVKLKNEMVAAHPDKGGTHNKFLTAFAKYSAAKKAAEHSLVY